MTEQEQLEVTAAEDSDELDPERLIDEVVASRYRIERKIGRGGMGVVYLASQEALNRKVVLKVLSSQLSEDEEAVGRFEREALQLSQLQHPNIVTIYDFGRDKGLAYIVMEYVEGETLTKLIRRQKGMSFELFAPIAAQILEALNEAHSRGVMHRDIKPSNIMLCERHGHPNFVKVLDFGLAKLLNDAGGEVTKKQNLVGSVAFLSPEQILGLDIDQRVDVYALGVLFYYMLAGSKPFTGDDDIGVLYQHIHKEPIKLTDALPNDHDIPPEVIHVIHRCLAKDKEHRPENARALLDELSDSVSRVNFSVPWVSGDFTANSPVQGHLPRPVMPNVVADDDATQITATSGMHHLPPNMTHHPSGGYPIPGQTGEFSGVYPHHTGEYSYVSGQFQIPQQQQRSNKGIIAAILLAALLVVGALGYFVSQQGQGNTKGPEKLDEVINRSATLIDDQKYGQAELLLDSVKTSLPAHPERAVKVSQLQDRIAIGKLVAKAADEEKRGKLADARNTYRTILARDSSHQLAREKLESLPEPEPENTLASLKLTGPAGGKVYLDDDLIGQLPLEKNIEPGKHKLAVVHKGKRWTQSISTTAGEVLELEPDLNTNSGAKKPVRRTVRRSTRRKKSPPKKKAATTPKTKPETTVDKPKTEPKKTKPKKKDDGLLVPIDEKKDDGDPGLLPVD